MPNKQCLSGDGNKTGTDSINKEKVIDINKYRWWRTGQHLRSKLAEFADHEMLTDEAGTARERFYSVINPDLADYEDEFLMERFFEWFIFDYRIRGRTLLEYITIAGNFSDQEIELLKKWSKTRSSIYQVIQIKNDNVVVLKDLLKEDELEVTDQEIVQELTSGQLLCIRVLPVGEENEFSTGGLILPFYSKDYILSRINLDAELFWSKNGRRSTWDVFLQHRSHIINALAMETASIVWTLGEKYEDKLNEVVDEDADTFQKLAKKATELFLDSFYEHWINKPMDALMGKTPLEASRTLSGRNKLKVLLQELVKTEQQRIQKGEPAYDLSKVCQKLNLDLDISLMMHHHNNIRITKSASENYPEVSRLIKAGLLEMGYHSNQINTVEKMWRNYSNIVSPIFKKPETWAAAVIYAVTKNSGNKSINQNTLAIKYNISASTISANYRSFYSTLQKNKLWDL